MKKDNSKTCLKISENVVAKIARLTALEIKGVSDISEKAVSVKNFGGVVEINIGIYVDISEETQTVAERVQYAVKDSIQSMTSIPVSKVCVNVCGMSLYKTMK